MKQSSVFCLHNQSWLSCSGLLNERKLNIYNTNTLFKQVLAEPLIKKSISL